MEKIKIKALCIAIMVIVVSMLVAITSMADDVDLEFVLKGIEYNDSLLKNCGVKISYTFEGTTYPEEWNAAMDYLGFKVTPLKEVRRSRYEYNVTLKQEKLRIEEKWYESSSPNEQDSMKLIVHHLWTYDGEKTQTIYYPESTGAEFQGAISSAIPRRSSVAINLSSITDVIQGGGLLSDTLQKDYPQITLVGKTQENGHECYLLEGTSADGTTLKIWIAPEIGFRPLRIESNRDKYEYIMKGDYEKYNGIWELKSGERSAFFRKSDSEKLLFNENRLTVNKAEFICPPEELPDSLFVLEVPTPIEKIWDADREIYIEVPSSEEDEEDTTIE